MARNPNEHSTRDFTYYPQTAIPALKCRAIIIESLRDAVSPPEAAVYPNELFLRTHFYGFAHFLQKNIH